jgi:hypothetical protein
MHNFCQCITWQSLLEVIHQGENYSNQRREGRILQYLYQLYTHGGTSFMSLKAFDGKQPCMGKAWFIMKTLEQHVLSSQDPPFELSLNLANVIKDQFLLAVEDVDDRPRLCKSPSQSILVG